MISTRGRYTLRVMIEIAEHNGDDYITSKDIAERQNISEKYLESILVVMTKNNLLKGLRGKGGGYKLTKPAKDYTIGSILRLAEGPFYPAACTEGDVPCEKKNTCKASLFWTGLYDVVNNYLDSITLEDLVNENSNSAKKII